MSIDIKKYLELIFADNLDIEATKEVFKLIMEGNVNEVQISSFLSLLQKSGIKAHHINGALEVMKSKMIKIKSPKGSLDTCGTGGDGKNSLNISTATALVLAAKGIPIAKHGNRALTSSCGSADVLKSLKINIDMNISKLEDCLNKTGICFMFAPNHHPAMKYVGPVRQQLGFRTIFNMLGPLMNPADVQGQLVGVYSKEVFDIYKEVFQNDPNKNVCLVSGFDGNDEISLDGSNLIFTKKNGLIDFDPETIGLQRAIKEEITGGDANDNADRILEIFNGKIDSFYHAVCINSAFGILVSKNIEINDKNIQDSLDEVKLLIRDGIPNKIIEKLSTFTNS